MVSFAGVEFVLEQRPMGAVLVKAGKPCGRGWIAEKKRCGPDKLQHALKNRRDDLERFANAKREAKGLKPKQKQELDISLEDLGVSEGDELKPKGKQKFQDISLEELEASDKMLEESLERLGGLNQSLDKFSESILAALDAEPGTFGEALNNIVPFNLKQEKLVSDLRKDLMDLQDIAKYFAMEQRDRGHVDWDDFAKKVQTAAMADKAISDRVESLNRLYKGKITQDKADTAAVLTRTFHALNPRKQIKMPKGTTQQDYYEIVNKLLDGDKAALKKYTVTRPSKKRKK